MGSATVSVAPFGVSPKGSWRDIARVLGEDAQPSKRNARTIHFLAGSWAEFVVGVGAGGASNRRHLAAGIRLEWGAYVPSRAVVGALADHFVLFERVTVRRPLGRLSARWGSPAVG